MVAYEGEAPDKFVEEVEDPAAPVAVQPVEVVDAETGEGL